MKKELKHYHADWTVVSDLRRASRTSWPLHLLEERFSEAEAFQIHATGRKRYETAFGIVVLPALELLSKLV